MNDKNFERLYIIVFVVGLAISLYDLFIWRP
jgi:hypothetical protein